MNDAASAYIAGFVLGGIVCFGVLAVYAHFAWTDLDETLSVVKERIEAECVIHEYQDTTKTDDKFIITFTCK